MQENTKTIYRRFNNPKALLTAAILCLLSFAVSLADASPVSIALEARPSPDCFPPSALQQAELEVDVLRLCPDCILAPEGHFRIVVEDPHYGWSCTVFDSRDREIAHFTWHGCLTSGLKKAIERIHQAAAAQILPPARSR